MLCGFLTGDGSVYVGEFDQDRRHGVTGTITFPDGTGYEGGWAFETMKGRGSMIWRPEKEGGDGGAFEGTFSDGTWHREGTMRWSDGTRYAGAWRDGHEHGRGVYQFPDGSNHAHRLLYRGHSTARTRWGRRGGSGHGR